MTIKQFVSGLNDSYVTNTVDFTTAEPGSPANGVIYINSTTGTSSGTSQSVTANHVYQWNSDDWSDITPNTGVTFYNQGQSIPQEYTGIDWVQATHHPPGDTDDNAGGGGFQQENSPTAIFPGHDAYNFGNATYNKGYPFSVLLDFTPTDIESSTNKWLVQRAATPTGNGWGVYMHEDDLYFYYNDGSTDDSAIIAAGIFITGQRIKLLLRFNPIVGFVNLYRKTGINIIASPSVTLTATGDVDGGGAIYLGSNVNSAEFMDGVIHSIKLFNYYIQTGQASPFMDGNIAVNLLPVGTGIDGTEMLAEGDLATHALWSATNDLSDTGGNLSYTWSADQASVATQADTDMAQSWYTDSNITTYGLRYEVSEVQAPSGTFTMGLNPSVALYNSSYWLYLPVAVAINGLMPYTAGTQEFIFIAPHGISTQDFTITATSSGGAASDELALDNLTLKRIGLVLNADETSWV